MDDKDNQDANSRKNGGAGEARPMKKPQWADSLRTMYDSVVDEPLPDSFNDLLARLDEPRKDGPKTDGPNKDGAKR